jgi:transposase InsO family protein
MGSKANPSRVGEIGVQGVRQNRRQIYAAASQPRAIPGLEKLPKAARIEYLGLRFYTIPFQTLYVFFVIRLANREVLHVEVTRHPTAEWAARQIVECCAWDRRPPRFLIHDRDSGYGMSLDRRVRHLGIRQVRTPFRSPRANAIAERWVKSARTECLDHLFVFGEAHLRRAMSAYKTYYNHWRPHRSLCQRAPYDSGVPHFRSREGGGKIVAEPVLGGLHHIYSRTA